MKLTSYWWHSLARGDRLQRPLRDLPESADAVVVGGGFTGLSAALTLLRHGRSVVVIDQGQPGIGASTRNGGICSGSIRIRHSTLTEQHGRDYADRVYAEGVEARDDLAKFISDERIDCQYHQPGWLLGAMSPTDYDRLAREAEALGAIPGHSITMLPKAELGQVINSDRFYGGMLRAEIAAYHPGRFFAGLLRVVEAEGGIICPESSVRLIEDDSAGKRVLTDRGSILARHVIVATNGYTGTGHGFSQFLRRRLVPVQSAIVVTEDLGEEAIRALLPRLSSFSTTANLAAYARPTPDGRRLLLGARSFDRLEPSRRTIDFLKAKVASIFPSLREAGIAYSWLGNVAYTKPQLPTIFEQDGVHYSAGYAGSGTVWARWLGRKTAEKVLGVSNRGSVFDGPPPPTIPLYDGDPWFLPAINAWYAFRDIVNERRFRP